MTPNFEMFTANSAVPARSDKHLNVGKS